LIISNYSFAQSTGTIKGTVVDENGTSLMYIPIALLEGDKTIGGVRTDEKGEFTIKDVTPGKYNVKVSSMGFETKLLKDVEADPSQIAYLNVKLKTALDTLNVVIIEEKFEKTIINPIYSTMTPIDAEQISNSAAGRDIIGAIVSLSPAVMPTNDGKDLLMRGSRRGTTSYIVDGNRTMDVPNVPNMGIASMEVLTGGIPAEYGDVTGGLVIITTKDYKWEAARNRIKKQAQEDAGK